MTSSKSIRVIWIDFVLEEKAKDKMFKFIYFIRYETYKGISELNT